MIREELKRLKTDPRTLRKFGVTIGTVLLLLGALLLWRHQPGYPYLVLPGALLVLLGLAAPRSLKLPYVGWMAVALVLGMVVSTVLLILFFYLVVTPLGLLARCLGKDFLEKKWRPEAASYWRMRDTTQPQEPSRYERQF